MRHEFRLGRGARWFGALGVTLALAAVPSVASAQSTSGAGAGAGSPGFNPEFTNTPYLAWNGESLRLEKCIPNDFGITGADLQAAGVSATWQVETWTGSHQDTTTAPQIAPNTEKVFVSDDYSDPNDPGVGGICAEANVVANTPGLARIELDVSANTVAPGTSGDGTVYSALSHEFLAAWMQLNAPSITSQSTTMNAGSTADPLDVHVTGTFPIDGNSQIQQEFGGASSLTMPNDWALMASKLAVDFSANNGTAGGRSAANDWDTSGESQSSATGNGADSGCPANDPEVSNPFTGAYLATQFLDNGDNCTGGGEDGPFSTSAGQSSDGTTIGPFDQVNAQQTDLPDGALNSQDAPMPAALIDVAIAQNTSPTTSTAGMGSLVSANKTAIDSRDGQGDDGVKNNLYAPFYDAYIPATARQTEPGGPLSDASSGVDGAFGNDFTGFLDIPGPGSDPSQYVPAGFGEGLYHFWDTANLGVSTGGNTKCLAYGYDAPAGDGVYRQTPSGAYEVDVYTDQNGEAMVDYVPGTGAYYDAMGADKNADGGCDLESQGANGITSLGSSAITATAEYPYKPSNFPNTSATTNVSVTNQFDKSLSYAPKGTGTNDQYDKIVIAHGQDVDGSPLSDETVCFTVQSNAGVTRFTGYVNGVYYGGSSPTADPNGAGQGRTCLVTDKNGNAAIEVLDSNSENVDVIADWTNEGLLRDIDVPFGSGTAPTGGPVPTGPVTQPTGGTTTTTSTTSTVTTTNLTAAPPTVASNVGVTPPTAQEKVAAGLAPTITSHKATASRSTVQFVRLLATTRTRYAVIRVSSKSHTVTLVLTLQEGHKIVHRTVKLATNRTVKLSLGKSVTKIKGAHLIG